MSTRRRLLPWILDGFAALSVIAVITVLAFLSYMGARSIWREATANRLLVVPESELPSLRYEQPNPPPPSEVRAMIRALRNHAAMIADNPSTARNLKRLIGSGVRADSSPRRHCSIVLSHHRRVRHHLADPPLARAGTDDLALESPTMDRDRASAGHGAACRP